MPETLGHRIRILRIRQDLSQKTLARRAGLTAPGLCQIEHDQHDPKAETLKCLAQALGVSSDYLLGLTESP